MERLDDIRAFVAVADALSFAEGARRMALSPAQTSKLVARLEDRLDARLLNRTTRDVSLTDGLTDLPNMRALTASLEPRLLAGIDMRATASAPSPVAITNSARLRWRPSAAFATPAQSAS